MRRSSVGFRWFLSTRRHDRVVGDASFSGDSRLKPRPRIRLGFVVISTVYAGNYLENTIFLFSWKIGADNRTVILPVVLYGCETWSLTLREERRLRVFDNRVLRMFGPKWDDVTGEWRKLHNDKLNDLYSSPVLCGWLNREEWDGRGV
jgi:hypothetical protein